MVAPEGGKRLHFCLLSVNLTQKMFRLREMEKMTLRTTKAEHLIEETSFHYPSLTHCGLIVYTW